MSGDASSGPGSGRSRSRSFRLRGDGCGPERHRLPRGRRLAVFAVGIHGPERPQPWHEILPDVVHVQGRFFDIGEDGREPVVPVEELVDVFVDGVYGGYIPSDALARAGRLA
jgi:hypothetical protein